MAMQYNNTKRKTPKQLEYEQHRQVNQYGDAIMTDDDASFHHDGDGVYDDFFYAFGEDDSQEANPFN
eukprot:Awhi_evm1s8696